MKNKKRIAMKKFAIQVAISFFLASIIIVIIYLLGNNKINEFIDHINMIAINVVSGEDKEISYNKVSKRLTRYPSYGKRYATLKIDSLDLNLPIFYGDSMSILRNGVDQYAGSYFPGEGGTTLLAAHNAEEYFQRLVDIKVNDLVVIETSYGTFKYRVDNMKIVHMSEVEAFAIKDDEEGLIMYTCYPVTRSVVGRRKHRFVVYAHRVGDNNG